LAWVSRLPGALFPNQGRIVSLPTPYPIRESSGKGPGQKIPLKQAPARGHKPMRVLCSPWNCAIIIGSDPAATESRPGRPGVSRVCFAFPDLKSRQRARRTPRYITRGGPWPPAVCWPSFFVRGRGRPPRRRSPQTSAEILPAISSAPFGNGLPRKQSRPRGPHHRAENENGVARLARGTDPRRASQPPHLPRNWPTPIEKCEFFQIVPRRKPVHRTTSLAGQGRCGRSPLPPYHRICQRDPGTVSNRPDKGPFVLNQRPISKIGEVIGRQNALAEGPKITAPGETET